MTPSIRHIELNKSPNGCKPAIINFDHKVAYFMLMIKKSIATYITINYSDILYIMLEEYILRNVQNNQILLSANDCIILDLQRSY